jgi:hypothetical protein
MIRPGQRYNPKSLRNFSPSLDLYRSHACSNSKKASRCPDRSSVFELRRDIFQGCRWTDQSSANSLEFLRLIYLQYSFQLILYRGRWRKY